MNDDHSIREVQNELLCLLKEFDRVCKENSINYSLHGGTLLGAIREHGFIPWDDDVDVVMTREEYEKLVLCFNHESDSFQLSEKCPETPKIFRRKLIGNMPFSWIDIFVYDGISKSHFAQKVRINAILFFQAMRRDKLGIQMIDYDERHRKMQRILFKGAYYLGRPFPKRMKQRWLVGISKHFLSGNGQLIHRSNDQIVAKRIIVPAQWMTMYIYVPFEDTEFMVTSYFHEILVSSYGENYMTPIKDTPNVERHDAAKKSYMKIMNLPIEDA